MLHIILLIWKNSKHYNTPARLVVLMREICNSLIIQACKYSSGEQIFTLIEQEDAAKAVDQLKTTLLVCGTFKSTYFDYKATANAECPANPWRIQVMPKEGHSVGIPETIAAWRNSEYAANHSAFIFDGPSLRPPSLAARTTLSLCASTAFSSAVTISWISLKLSFSSASCRR